MLMASVIGIPNVPDRDRAGTLHGTDRLDRASWFRPLVSIVITHFNYSTHIKDALFSILDQSHENWECVVVDDASATEHRCGVERIVSEIGSNKIRLLQLSENGGQIPAFFTGLETTTGEFVCILDPDDRYDPTFLEEMLKAHLNDTVLCPVVGCGQRPLKSGAVIGGTLMPHKLRHCSETLNGLRKISSDDTDYLLYFPAAVQGVWGWPSTSSMMFRRSGLNFMRPYKALAYKRALDSYLAQGAHMLGGALFLTKPLVYRGVHDKNSWLSDTIFATGQILNHDRAERRYEQARVDVLAALLHNGAAKHLAKGPSKMPRSKRWRRSIEKRWRRLFGSRTAVDRAEANRRRMLPD
jgi:hypothetical protein